MLRETAAVHCENNTEHTNTTCDKSAGYVEADSTYTNQYVLKC